MSIDTISGYADACLDRPYLTRWFPASITLNDNPYTFGIAELAVIEETLRYIERGHSLFIHDPIPSNRILLGICLAYVRTQDPRFPNNGIVGRNRSLLGFPALHQGYVSELDEFRLDSIGQSPGLLDRKPIDKMSETHTEADIHTAKNNFEFDEPCPSENTGAIFVDLRKPEWGATSRRFGEIMSLYEATDCPIIFYTNEMTTAARTIEENVDSIHITNELLATGEPDTLPKNPSITSQFEHIINTSDVVVEQITIGYPDLYQIVSDLTAMRNDLQSSPNIQGVVKMEVGWLFNLLTRLPVMPQYWDAVVADNYYQQGVRELLENLRGKAQRLDGREADVLINFCEAANALHGRLNTDHPLQQKLFELIATENRKDPDAERIVVVHNEFEKKAILHALTYEDRELAPNVSIKTADNIEPTAEAEVIIPRPLDSNSYLYDFPAAKVIAFLQFEPWAPIVEERLENGLGKIGATINKHEIGQIGGRPSPGRSESKKERESPVDAYERPDNSDDADPTQALREDFENESSQSGTSTSTDGQNQISNPDLELTLTNSETRRLTNQSRVSVLRKNGDIGRKQAKDLEVGETLLLLDSATEDIYDLFVESAHKKDRLRKAESVVERWRSILQEGLSSELTERELLNEMQERGSEITNLLTISGWRTGKVIGPQDPNNVRLILEIFAPEMESTADATVEAMKQIRKEHRNIGRQARKAIETQVNNSIGKNLSTEIPQDVDQASENVQKAEIEAITPLST